MPMTDTIAPSGPDPDVAAAELALGLLAGADRAAALRRLLAEPAFAREVEMWRAHFGTLFAAIPAVAPRPEVEQQVLARLDGSRAGPSRAPSRVWQSVAAISSIAAAAMFGLLMVRPQPTLAPPIVTATPAPMVAAMMIEGQAAPIVATYDASTALLSIPDTVVVPAGRSAQLWAIVGTGAPQPLGVFRQAGDKLHASAPSPRPIEAGTTFAISIEPLGGSPTGLPTGPVIGSGTLIRA